MHTNENPGINSSLIDVLDNEIYMQDQKYRSVPISKSFVAFDTLHIKN